MQKYIFLIAFVLFFASCWGGQWVNSPSRVEDVDIRTAEMNKSLDSLTKLVEQNEVLLRGIQAQAGIRNGDHVQNLLELTDQLERMLGSGISSQAEGTPAAVQVTYEEAFRQYQQGGYSVASEGFYEVAMGYPDASIADDALYYMALCHQSQGETHRAIEELVAVFYRYPTSDRAASALARAAAIYGANSAEAELHRLETVILETYPDSEEARLIANRRENR